MGRDGRPAVGYRVGRLSVFHGLRFSEPVIKSQKAFPIGIEAIYICVYGIESVMIAALLVLGFMVNGAAVDFHFARIEIALEIGGIVVGVPKAPFEEAP